MLSLPVLLLGIKTVRISEIELESSPGLSPPAEWDKLEEKSNNRDPSSYTLYVGCEQKQGHDDRSAVFTIGWYLRSFTPRYSAVYLHMVV